MPDFLLEPDNAFPLPNSSTKTLHAIATKTSAETLHEFFVSNPPNPLTQRLFRNTLTPRILSHVFPSLPIHRALLRQQPDALLAYTTAIPASVFQKIASQWHPLHSSLYTVIKSTLENLIL